MSNLEKHFHFKYTLPSEIVRTVLVITIKNHCWLWYDSKCSIVSEWNFNRRLRFSAGLLLATFVEAGPNRPRTKVALKWSSLIIIILSSLVSKQFLRFFDWKIGRDGVNSHVTIIIICEHVCVWLCIWLCRGSNNN